MLSKYWHSIMVAVTDPFARQQAAVMKAAAMARRCSARVTLFNSFLIPQPVSDVPAESRKQILAAAIRQRHQALERLASKLRLRDPVECVVRWDSPTHEAIVRQVLRAKPDLLIAESQRHGLLVRALLTNTDWELIRSCPCPVWFVRSAKLANRPRLLVAVDPRHTNDKPARLDARLLEAARVVTDQLDGTIRVVHAYGSPVSPMPGPPQSLARTARTVQRLARKYDVEAADCFVAEGSPTEVIASTARQSKTHVLVMGAVSRSLLTSPVIGNTAERVIDQVDCDVFVMKPARFKTPVRRAVHLSRPGRRGSNWPESLRSDSA